MLAAAAESKAWPFEEARKIIDRYKGAGFPETVLFETGYGPSGLPHIGTFGEVARTSMVRHAFRVLTGDRVKTQLLCFSDDVDGMRKVPDNVPNRDLLVPHLGKPLTRVPDPFGEYESFGHHNNAMLRRFLDTFGFDYEFASALDYYTSGRFDDGLVRMLENYDKVMEVMLPTLREERRRTYSPILPIHPETGVVMQVPIEEVHPEPRAPSCGPTQAPASAGKRSSKAAAARRSGSPTGRCAGRCLASTTRCPARITSTTSRPAARSAASSAAGRRRASTTSSSSTKTARRSRSPRATASPSTNG